MTFAPLGAGVAIRRRCLRRWLAVPRLVVRPRYQYATEIRHYGTEARQGNNNRSCEQTLTPSVLSWMLGDVDASLQRRIMDPC